MPTYQIFDTLLDSDLALDAPLPTDSSTPSHAPLPTVRIATAHQQPKPSGNLLVNLVMLQVWSDLTLLTIPGVAKFWIESHIIWVSLKPGTPISSLTFFIQNYALPIALTLSGKVVFRATAIARGDQTVLLVGDMGAGKSTFALQTIQHAGFRLLSDELIIYDPDTRNFHTQPGCLFLWPDSARAAGIEEQTLKINRPGINKKRLVLSNACEPVKQKPSILLLDLSQEENLPSAGIKLTKPEIVVCLLKSLRWPEFYNQPEQEKWGLQQIGGLSILTTGYKIFRGADFSVAPIKNMEENLL